jgi:hypothetical protein
MFVTAKFSLLEAWNLGDMHYTGLGQRTGTVFGKAAAGDN